MPEILCPKCNAKGPVAVKQAKSDKGRDVKFYECPKCRSVWTNSADIASLPVQG